MKPLVTTFLAFGYYLMEKEFKVKMENSRSDENPEKGQTSLKHCFVLRC